MNSDGIAKAKKRLERARSAFRQLQAAQTWDDFEPVWSDFLLASNAIYSILEQATKSSAKGAPWFGRKKRERKDDQLLSYMHHARNSDEHGIDPVAQALPYLSEPVEENGQLISLTMDNGKPVKAVICGESGNQFELKFSDPRPVLVRVYDRRYGDYFDPPKMHLELSVLSDNPFEVGSLFIIYLENLILEAEKFVE